MAMKIGEKIKVLRKGKNISQESLAKALGVTFQAVSKWETNATVPDVSLIPSIASFFGVSIDALFDYNVFENEQKIDSICHEANRYRFDDPVRAEEILREGLKQFPSNEALLTVLVYGLFLVGTMILLKHASYSGMSGTDLQCAADRAGHHPRQIQRLKKSHPNIRMALPFTYQGTYFPCPHGRYSYDGSRNSRISGR